MPPTLNGVRTREMRVGDWVQVRTKEQILKTLDGKGQLDGMPFMPEMFQFCGKRFQIYKRAHKTCDYTSPHFRSRRLQATVHLETRCDGEAHGGCQAGCLLYWKHAWLRPVDDHSAGGSAPQSVTLVGGTSDTSGERGVETGVWAGTQVSGSNSDAPTYVCQATQVPFATTELHWWDVRQYVEDYWSGNVSLGRIVSGFIYSTYYSLSQAGFGLGRPMRWLYDRLRWIWRGSRWPRTPGVIPAGGSTPTASLNLQQGELVRVRPHEEILQTVTTANLHRGMHWDAELVPYCGGTYRVLRRLTRIIDERTGKMVEMKSPCIVLDSVVCQARYSDCRMLCPKGMYPYWREIWLERVASSGNGEESRPGETSAIVAGNSR
jgi:hypothetical protein